MKKQIIKNPKTGKLVEIYPVISHKEWLHKPMKKKTKHDCTTKCFDEKGEYQVRREHTPGPWHIEKTPKYFRIFSRVLDENNLTQWICNTIDKPNANLIAAAPDLLEALEAMQKCDGTDLGELEDLFKRAEAAIAKAKGGRE